MHKHNPTIGSFDENIGRMNALIEVAKAFKCDMVALPEMAISGYPPRDLLEQADFIEANLAALRTLI